MKQVLKEGGASREFYMSELVTHVISDYPVDSDTLAFKGQDYVTAHVCPVIRGLYALERPVYI